MINILIYLHMFTWLYIIYFSLFCNRFYILYDKNNNKYAMIDIFSIIDNNLFNNLLNRMESIDYSQDKYIGFNNLNKDILLVIPIDSINLTNNIIVTCDSKTKSIPFKMTMNHLDYKKMDSKLELNTELYLENIYNYKKNNPIFLLSNEFNPIKVNLETIQ